MRIQRRKSRIYPFQPSFQHLLLVLQFLSGRFFPWLARAPGHIARDWL